MDNFLEEIKKVQDKQAFQPSADAWERMDAMLLAQTQADKKKRRKYYLAYAAVFLGLLLGLATFFAKDNTLDIEQDVVKTQQKTPSDTEIKSHVIEEKKSNAEKVLEKSNQNNVAITKPKTRIKKQTNSKKQVIAQKETQLQAIKETQVATVAQVKQPQVKHKEKRPLMHTSDEAINAMLAAALHKETKAPQDIAVKSYDTIITNTNTTYQFQVAENTLQQTAATKGDMTVNKFLKHVVQTGVDTVSDIVTSNDN